MRAWRGVFQNGARRKGQTMVEFALALPLLLLLLFGIVEFARIFHAWLTVATAARQAARYAASGQYKQEYCPEVAERLQEEENEKDDPHTPSYAEMDLADGAADCRVPAYADGVDTEHPGDDWYYQNVGARLQDAARLYSIRDEARVAAGSIAVAESVSGDITRDNDFDHVNTDYALDGDATRRGYFHVTVCSTRENFVFDRNNDYDQGANKCFYETPDDVTDEEDARDDAGGPNDRVVIVVDFNHPLITPIRGVASNERNFIHLFSLREMVIERFRTARVIGLPPAFDIPEPPTDTPTPTETPIPTETLTPTITPSPTPTPDCRPYAIDSFRYTNTSRANVAVDVHNTGAESPLVDGIRISWPKDDCLESDWRADWFQWGGSTIWGSGVNDYTPSTDAMPGGDDRGSFVEGKSLPAGSTRVLAMDLDGSPSEYYALRHPGGPYFNFEVLLDNGCLLSYSPDLVATPEPDCSGLEAGEIYYLDDPDELAVVVSNTTSTQDFGLIGFSFDWPSDAPTLFPNLRTDKMYWSDTPRAGSFEGLQLWDGDDTTPPSSGCHPCYGDTCGGSEPSWTYTRAGDLPRDDVDTWMIEFDNGGSHPNLKGSYFPGEYAVTLHLSNVWGGICTLEAIQSAPPAQSCDNLTSTLLYLTSDDVEASLTNLGGGDFQLDGVHITWPAPEATPWPNMYVDKFTWLPDDVQFWSGDDDTSPTDVTLSPAYTIGAPWAQTFESDYGAAGNLASNYLHGRQFHITFDYAMASGEVCPSLEVDGKYGPVIQVVDPPRSGGGYEVYPDYSPISSESGHPAGDCIEGEFTIQALTYDRDYGAGASDGSGIYRVYFQVEAPDGHIVDLNDQGEWKPESYAPYCAFGDGGGSCYTRDTTNSCHTWDARDCTGTDYFTEGIHTLRVEARDNDSPGDRLRTLFVTHFEICGAYDATPTPPPTAVPTPTFTPMPSATPTRTSTPTRVPTSTRTPTPTPTGPTPTYTLTPTPTYTFTPAPITGTPTDTPSPTPTWTPWSGGGD